MTGRGCAWLRRAAMGNTWHVHPATTGHLGMAAASGGLLRLRLFFLLIIGVHARDESKENQETNDLLHKLFEFPAVHQNALPMARKF